MSDAPVERAQAEDHIRLDPDRPYPGPASFEEGHAAFFFGRKDETAELFSHVSRQPLTVLYGKSGLGKTSLLQAGLFPMLRRARLVPVPIRFTFPSEKNPSPPSLLAQIRAALRAAIERGDLDGAEPARLDDPKNGEATGAETAGLESLWRYFRTTRFWDAEGEPAVPVLVLDQFEEVFTLGGGVGPQIKALVEELSDLVEDRIPRALRAALESRTPGVKLPLSRERPHVKVLVALREDFLADLDRLTPMLPSLGTAAARYSLGPLSHDAAMKAVIEPGRARSLILDDVADLLVHTAAKALDVAPENVKDITVESSILALYCHELNELRLKAGQKAITRELVLANRDIILDSLYSRCLRAVRPEKRWLAQILVEEKLLIGRRRHVFPVASLGEIEEPGLVRRKRRRTLSLEDVRPLIDGRLLRKEPRLGADYLEIIHDVLIDAIDERKKQRLYEEKNRRRDIRIGLGAVAALGVALVVTGGILSVQWKKEKDDNKAEEERSRLQATAAGLATAVSVLEDPIERALDDGRPGDAAAILAAAHRLVLEARAEHEKALQKGIQLDTPSPSRRLALLSNRLVAMIGDERVLVKATGELGEFDLSHDGSRGAVVLDDGRSVKLFDASSRRTWDAEPLGPPPASDELQTPAGLGKRVDWFSGRIQRLLVSGDGSRVFAVGEKGQVAAWDVASGKRLVGFRTTAENGNIEIDRAGQHVLAWGGEEKQVSLFFLKDRENLPLKDQKTLATAILEQGTRRAATSVTGSAARVPPIEWARAELASNGERVVTVRLTDRTTEAQAWTINKTDQVVAGATLRQEDLPIDATALSPDGAFLATSGKAGIHLWTLDSGGSSAPRELARSGEYSHLLGFDHASSRLWTESTDSLLMWDVSESSAPKGIPLGDNQESLAVRLSSDQRTALVYSARTVRLYDVARGSIMAELVGYGFGRPRLGDAGMVYVDGRELRARSFSKEALRDRYLWGISTGADRRVIDVAPQGLLPRQDGRHLLFVAGKELRYVDLGDPEMLRAGQPSGRLEGSVPYPSRTAWRGSAKESRIAGGWLAVLADNGDVFRGQLGAGERRPVKLDPGPGPNSPERLELSRDGSWLAATAGARVWVWDDAGASAWSAEATSKLTALAIASDGRDQARLVVGTEKGQVMTARIERAGGPGRFTGPLAGSPHRDAVTALAIGPTGVLASGAGDGTIALWTADTGALSSGASSPRHTKMVHALGFVEGGAALLSVSSDATARVWDAKDGAVRCTMRDHSGGIEGIQLESDGGDRVITLDDVMPRRSHEAMSWSTRDCVSWARWNVRHAGFFPGKRDWVVLAGGRLSVVDTTRSESAAAGGPRRDVLWGAFAGGSRLITGDAAGQLFSFTIGGGLGPAPLEATIAGRPFVASADGRMVAVTPLGEVREIGPTAQATSARLPMEPGWLVRGIALSKDRKSLITVESGRGALQARRFDLSQWETVLSTKALDRGESCDAGGSGDPDPLTVAATLDGAPVAMAIEDSGCIRMWSEQGALLLKQSLTLNGRPVSIALSPGAHHVVIGLASGEVSFWELRRGAGDPERWQLERQGKDATRHRQLVRTIVFHPGGRFVASVGIDGDIWLWDGERAKAVVQLESSSPSGDLLNADWAAFSPDGDDLVAGAREGRIKIWDTRTTADPKEILEKLEKWMPELNAKPAP